METKEFYERVSHWLMQGKATVLAAMNRLRIQHELCPMMCCDEKSKAALLRALSESNADIHQRIEQMRAFECETEHDETFISRALGPGVAKDDALYLTMLLLVFSRISPALASEATRIARIIQIAGGPSPVDCLKIRDGFREDGYFRRFVRLTNYTYCLDDAEAEISETALNIVFRRSSTEYEEQLSEKTEPCFQRSKGQGLATAIFGS